jgi:hypothetical protein
MKHITRKKAQVYGLATFIYAISIAVILLIGLIGMSKEFESKSQSAEYKYGTAIVTQIAEQIKKIMEEERGYSLDKSLYLTGAFGGYSSYSDTTGKTCSVRISPYGNFLPEKKIFYWQEYDNKCIPTDSEVLSVVTQYANEFFQTPAATITNALSKNAGKTYDFTYIMKLSNYTNKTIDTSWFATGTEKDPDGTINTFSKVTLNYLPGDPIIEYSFDPFMHLNSKTRFFYMRSAAENFVTNNELSNWFKSDFSPVHLKHYIDEDFIIAKKETGVPVKNCTTNPYPSDYCAQNSSELYHPFKALVDYAFNGLLVSESLLGNSNSYSNCNIDPTKVSLSYTKTCKISTRMNNATGYLELDTSQGTSGFSGGCVSVPETIDDKAIKCVLMLNVNHISHELFNLGVQNADYNTAFDYKISFNTFNLTYNGVVDSKFLEYNSTTYKKYYGYI